MAYLQFLGAAGTVTGSKHLINTRDDSSRKPGLQVLVDCGLFQGAKEWRLRNWEDTPVPARDIDAVVLTHAHLDHCGWIPRLAKEGFQGPIYATPPTIDLCSVILTDSGHLQEEEARFHNKKKSSKHHPALPLYTLQEAEDCMSLFRPIPFEETRQLSPQLSFRFVRAGHILGSSMVELFLGGDANARKLLFTGDIGRVPMQPNAPGRVVLAGPERNEDPEILVMESTYGNRAHPHDDVRPRLAEIISQTVNRGGSVVVPAFAVERTQKFLFLLKELMESNQVPRVPVFVDSPMAIKAVEIFMKYAEEFNEEARQLVQKYGSPLDWDGFHFAPKQEDSMKINEMRYPCIIVSSSGMVTGGRILHHLLLRLPDPRNQVLFIGFQAPGTRGDTIQRGAESVRIFSEAIPIRAQVATLEQFSDHADTEELLGWLRTFKSPPKNTFLVHGEPEAASRLQHAISTRLGWNVNIAHWLEKVPLG
ncbi:MAG: MBL fold metallo-hydrolase RNA specificity domain-containing protein [Candidatus Angelobacter sp.]